MSSYQCYHAFTSRRYRVCTFALMPLALILLQCLLILWRETQVFLFVSGIIPGYFVIADVWVFGSSCTCRYFRVEYLKSSATGMRILRGALIADCLARYIVTAVVLGLPVIADVLYQKLYLNREFPTGALLLNTLHAIFVSCAVTALCLLISRYLSQNTFILMVSYLGLALVLFSFVFFEKGIAQIAVILIAAAVSAGCNVLTVRKVLKYVRRSYYDQTDKI